MDVSSAVTADESAEIPEGSEEISDQFEPPASMVDEARQRIKEYSDAEVLPRQLSSKEIDVLAQQMARVTYIDDMLRKGEADEETMRVEALRLDSLFQDLLGIPFGDFLNLQVP